MPGRSEVPERHAAVSAAVAVDDVGVEIFIYMEITSRVARAAELALEQPLPNPCRRTDRFDPLSQFVLARHYGLAGTFAAGDLNGDDKVDFADLLLLAQHYGKPLPD